MIALEPYPTMKEASVPWITELPAYWRQPRGKALFIESRLPVSASDEIVTCFRDGQVTLRRNRRATGFMIALKETGYQGVRKGQLVIHAMDAFAGAVGVSDSDGKCTPEYIVCNPREVGTSPGYFARALRLAAHSGFIEVACQAVRERAPRLRYPNFGAMLLPRPPVDEQAAIVRYLDHVDRRVRRLVRTKRKLIALLTEQKQAIIHRAVTRGLDPDVPLKDSGVEWMGEVPEHWEVVPLKFLCRGIQNGATPSTSEEDYYQDGTVPWFGPSSISAATELGAPVRYLARPAFDDGKARLIEGPAVLVIVIGATAGKMGLFLREGATNQQITAFELKPNKIEPQFAIQQLRSCEPWLKSTASTATIPILDSGVVNRLPLAFPGIAEQERILSALADETRSLDTTVDRAKGEIELLNEYRTRLIADVVTGKLDVRDAAATLPEVDPIDAEDDLDDALEVDAIPEEAEA